MTSKHGMRYRRLGGTTLHTSVVGMGCSQLSGEWGKPFEQQEVDAMFRQGEESGINLLDTAECYGDHLSEDLIGRAIAGRRDRWIVCTKFGHRFRGPFDRDNAFDLASVRASLEQSLRALRTDWIDVYYFHSGSDQQLESEGVWEFLQGAVRAGSIRYLGISLSGQNQAQLLPQVQRASALGAAVVQVVYSRLRPEAGVDILPACAAAGLGVITRVALAQGFLSGQLAGAEFPPADIRSRMNPADRAALAARADRIRREEVPHGVNMAQWALTWSLAHEAVSATIVGCKSDAQVAANAAAGASALLSAHPLDVPEPTRPS